MSNGTQASGAEILPGPDPDRVQMIPIDRVLVINRRQRGRGKFQQITNNIAKVGLKRPITAAWRSNGGGGGGVRYHVACGQGRLEACTALGQTHVAAVVVDVDDEQLLLTSLVENLARRRYVGLELIKEIGAMKQRGHDFAEIAKLTDLDVSYVRGVIRLLNKAEHRLLRAVDKGQIPVSVAITIASADDQAVQRALAEAYERNDLRGKALLRARRLIELRRTQGKSASSNGKPRRSGEQISGDQVMRTYQRERSRQQVLVRKAKLCEMRLQFVVSAMRSLLASESFVNLLRAEGLLTMPQFLSEQVRAKAG